MSGETPMPNWSKRAARVGRVVARFRLADRPRERAWDARRIGEGGGRCFGCDDSFQLGESHVEVVVAEALVMELHDECFETWKRIATGPPSGDRAGGDAEAAEGD